MLDDITELRTFVRIVSTGSLSAAGRDLGVALSVVSKRLATLERRTATTLITRSTRRLAVTEEGQQLFERAQRILAEIDEAEAVLSHGRLEPQGVLRISAPHSLGRSYVAAACRDLVRSYPKISVDLVLTDRLVELIDERMDVAVRIGLPPDSDLVMRKLSDNHRVVVAAPDYLARRGTPATPNDLVHHDCLLYSSGPRARWRLIHRDGRAVEVDVTSRLRCDSGEVAHDWAREGCGLVMKSWVDVAADLAAGRLARVLPDWQSDPAPVCALFPRNRQMPTRVRLFLDAITAQLERIGTRGAKTRVNTLV
ncbi:LysR family transcriptional regulator [Bradyrhizobium sp. U87765 SZCCT0131]|uniref:LysR family transcriptional regulator n=1 Tax=unclassified Bradyrhizobium TaxID=2631580 RepID=UPI001BA89EA8|nr:MULTISPECIES: LysR family transcriptional regulator [unclassified Bradyrhizobium]MBR1216624.1 LysR family transcriptional regulator [Bradyrhizobium sp. U87765 SZCCT0131]MBR1259620.1 LysR family transcriptional regulator [Bradyrhizobium sp. U87765 SZCCT0134]MBR1305761.1 LysR family transcriptional regulator [Bradyrhizobium sp. U87765 SZCCT0110]MBR1322128.1 LysR family transcriptional regulator [Bradyrhizobium sp. U87765 SZCCT0109]MBR1350594.1 LysR family transcriptional regulator [Bradyrhizo